MRIFIVVVVVVVVVLAGKLKATDQCHQGRLNGTLTKKCIMDSVEDRSDNGKMMFADKDWTWNIHITFTLLSVDDLRDDGTMQSRIRLKTEWPDENLGWPAKELANKEDTILMPSSLARWPKFVLLDDQDSQNSLMKKMSEFPVKINNKGDNTMMAEVTTVTACNMDTTYFPNDIQTCRIKIALIPLSIRDIANLTVSYEHDDDLFDESVDWPLEPTYSSTTTGALIVGVVTDSDDGTRTKDTKTNYAYLEVSIKRNGHDVNVALVHPMYTFSFITTIIYILPPESGERIGSAITMVLTMAVTMLAVKDMLPNADIVTYGEPFFSTLCRICFGQTMVLLFVTIFVLAVWSNEHPRPRCLRAPGRSRKQQRRDDSIDMDSREGRGGDFFMSQESQLDDALFWRRFARGLDIVCFCLNLIVSFVSVVWAVVNINSPVRPTFRHGAS